MTRLDVDVATGAFRGEFIWEHSCEAEVRQQDFGQAEHPACWMQIGYASEIRDYSRSRIGSSMSPAASTLPMRTVRS